MIGAASDAPPELMQRGQSEPVYTTVISAHENINGWQAEFNTAARSSDLVTHYARLEKLLRFYGQWQVLPFDPAAEVPLCLRNVSRPGEMSRWFINP